MWYGGYGTRCTRACKRYTRLNERDRERENGICNAYINVHVMGAWGHVDVHIDLRYAYHIHMGHKDTHAMHTMACGKHIYIYIYIYI